MKLTELQTFRKTSNVLYLLEVDEKQFLVKRYRDCDSQRRRDTEASAMAYWKSKGFLVPDLAPMSLPKIEGVYLVMSFIDGLSLREYLSQSDVEVSEKMGKLSEVFRQVYTRHKRAVENNDRQLIHYDPSTGNILIAKQDLFTIDFEAPVRNLSVQEAAAIELATLCRWITRDLGLECVRDILLRLVEAYDCPMVLHMIVKRTAGRSFQFYHRWRDRKRKSVYPQEVTKYDIADTLAKLL